MKSHKVGYDAVFTKRTNAFSGHTMNASIARPTFSEARLERLAEGSAKRAYWILGAITTSFFISQSVLLLSGK